MKILSVEFGGLGGYQNTAAIDFRNLNLVLLEGSNGVGKSSLLDSITWILFDKTVRGGTKSEWVNDVIKKGYGKLILENNDKTYEIYRERGKSGGIFLYFKENSTLFESRSTQDLQKLLEERLGFTYDIFVNSVMFGQGDILDLAMGTDKRKKEIIGALLGFEEMERSLVAIRKAMNVYENEIKYDMEDLRKKEEKLKTIPQITLEELQAQENLRDSLSKELNSYVEEEKLLSKNIINVLSLEKISDEIRNLEKELNEGEPLRNELQDLELKIKNQESLSALKKGYCSNKENLEKEYLFKKYEKQSVEKDIRTIEKNIKKISESQGRCPVCLQPLLEDKKKEVITSFENKLNELINQRRKIEEHVSSFEKTIKEIQSKIDSFGEDTLSKDVSRYEFIKSRLEALDSKRLRLDKIKIDKDTLISTIGDSVANMTSAEINAKLLQIKSKTAKLHEDFVSISMKIVALKKNYEIQEELRKEIKELKEKSLTMVQKLEHYKFLEKLLGLGGVRNQILEDVIPFLEKESNTYLSTLLPGVSVSFSTQTEGKSVIKNEFSLNLYDTDTNSVRDFKLWSGGEKMLISLALRFALWKVSYLFSQSSLDVLFLDEIFGCLEEKHRENVMTFLDEQQRDLKIPILVVEHMPDIMERFKQVLRVTKTVNGSCINYES